MAAGRSISPGRGGAPGGQTFSQQDQNVMLTTSSITTQPPTQAAAPFPRPEPVIPRRSAGATSPLASPYRARLGDSLYIDTSSPVRTSTSTLATSPGATNTTATGLHSPGWQSQPSGWPWSTGAVVPSDGTRSLPSSPGGGFDGTRSHLPSPTLTLSPSRPRGPSMLTGGAVHHHHHHYHLQSPVGMGSMTGSLEQDHRVMASNTLDSSIAQTHGPQSPTLNSSLAPSQSSPWRPNLSVQPFAGPPAWQMQSQVGARHVHNCAHTSGWQGSYPTTTGNGSASLP
jgi:hypothetical protein